MKITRSRFHLSVIAVVFFCFAAPSLYSAEKTISTIHQKFASIVNLNGESSANTIAKNGDVIEFRGNELVDSVAGQMAANGTLPHDSALALPKDERDMTYDARTASLPLALVEKDLQGATNFNGMEFGDISKDVAKIARDSVNITAGISSVSNPGPTLGSGLGTGASPASDIHKIASIEFGSKR